MPKKELKREPPQPIIFSYKEVVEALLKHRRIKEGIWQLRVEFGLGAANIKGPQDSLSPAAIIPVINLGMQPTDTVNNISVDASTIHPSTPATAPRRQKKAKISKKRSKA